MEYEFRQDDPISEEDALAQGAALGLYCLAFDLVVDEDEPLHWHEFEAATWAISGTGAFADEHGNVTEIAPGCRLQAPAGWLHRNPAGPRSGWSSAPTSPASGGPCRSTRTRPNDLRTWRDSTPVRRSGPRRPISSSSGSVRREFGTRQPT